MKFNLRLPSLPKRSKKLRANTAARRMAPAEEYDEEEPTMKLSSAFVVVLLLHLIAVGGIYAFNSIKAHRAPSTTGIAAYENVVPVETPAPVPVAPAAATQAVAVTTEAPAPVKTAAAPVKAAEPVRTETPHKASPRDSGTLHTVTKGENPERIARKFGVSYNDLIKLNHIDDPTKLRIGQKLHIPVKIKAATN